MSDPHIRTVPKVAICCVLIALVLFAQSGGNGPLLMQNAGVSIGAAIKLNCSTGTACSNSGGTVTLTTNANFACTVYSIASTNTAFQANSTTVAIALQTLAARQRIIDWTIDATANASPTGVQFAGTGITTVTAGIGSQGSYSGTGSMTIGTGSQTFTLGTTGLNTIYIVGSLITVVNGVNSMSGTITAYTPSSGSLTFTSSATSGSGTFSSWTVTITNPYFYSGGTKDVAGAAATSYGDGFNNRDDANLSVIAYFVANGAFGTGSATNLSAGQATVQLCVNTTN